MLFLEILGLLDRLIDSMLRDDFFGPLLVLYAVAMVAGVILKVRRSVA